MPEALQATEAKPWLQGHPLAVTADRVVVADTDNGDVVVMNRETLAVERRIQVDYRPERLVVGPSGTAWVTLRQGGEVAELDLASGAVVQRVAVGTEPLGLAMSAAGDEVYVALVQDAKVVTLDAGTGEVLRTLGTRPQPRAVTATTTGQLVIAHLDAGLCTVAATLSMGAGACDAGWDGGYRPFRQGNPKDHFMFQSSGQNLTPTRGVAVTTDPSTGEAYAVHTQVSAGTTQDVLNSIAQGQDGVLRSETLATGYYGSTVQTSGAGIEMDLFPIEVSITKLQDDGESDAVVPDLPVRDWHTDQPMEGRLDQPSDIAHHPFWSLAFVTGYGTDNVLCFNTSVDDPMRSPLAEVEVGMAPKGIAFSPDGSTAYVMNEHSFTVSSFDVRPLLKMAPVSKEAAQELGRPDLQGLFFLAQPQVRTHLTRTLHLVAAREVAYGTDPAPADVRAGRRIFHYSRNAALTDGRRMACASCHLEGADDHLVWMGKDGPRQTPSLAGRLHGTEPFKWTGTSGSIDESMNETTERMGGQGMTAEERGLLDAYLSYGLVEPPNPNLGGQLTGPQARGKAIFGSKETQCSTCHVGGATDGKVHDVGTASEADTVIQTARLQAGDDGMKTPGFYNTPSLKGLFHSAPYLHDGSAATLEEVIEKTADKMGKVSHLNGIQRSDLVAYLKTL